MIRLLKPLEYYQDVYKRQYLCSPPAFGRKMQAWQPPPRRPMQPPGPWANLLPDSTPYGCCLLYTSAETIPADGKEYKGTFVCMGNPHVVIFVDDIKEVDLPAVDPKLENHPLFPERTNVEFVAILPDQSLRMRVWRCV